MAQVQQVEAPVGPDDGLALAAKPIAQRFEFFNANPFLVKHGSISQLVTIGSLPVKAAIVAASVPTLA